MKFVDHYRVLGISAQATAAEIKTAYRKLARSFHPDVNKRSDAEGRFAEVAEAHAVLNDAGKRAAFDALRGDGWRDGQEMTTPPVQAFHRNGASAASDLGLDAEFLQSLFGTRGPRRSGFSERGGDLQYPFSITLEESYQGGQRQIQVQGLRTITVAIPTGVVEGSRIRLRGQGRPGDGPGSDGDLYLVVHLAPHDRYHVSGHDLTMAVPIAPWEAALGAQIAVPTLGGQVIASIPPGSQGGQRLRLKGRGLPGDPPGDQYLALNIAMPATSSDALKRLYRELATTASFDPRAGLGF